MPTPWTYPTIAAQFCEVNIHIPWQHYNTEFINTELDLSSAEYEINQIRSKTDLLHISNPTVNDLKMKTYYLVLKGFSWTNLPTTVSGIEARIHIRRTGRITDETISLYNDGIIGLNKANIDLANNKTYGNETDLWGLEEITSTMLQDPNFGIVVRLQSHPSVPHRVTPNFDHVQLRAW